MRIVHIAISFKSTKFDVSKERTNPINPIFGESLLKWFKSEIEPDFDVTEPDAEDWGWYSYIDWKGRQYMLGASTYFEEGNDPKSELEWVLQIDKSRTFIEKLFGKAKISQTDECVLYLKAKLESEPKISSVSFE